MRENKRSGGEGGILTYPLLASYRVLNNIVKNLMDIVDFFVLS
jgi:hypothetical protein